MDELTIAGDIHIFCSATFLLEKNEFHEDWGCTGSEFYDAEAVIIRCMFYQLSMI